MEIKSVTNISKKAENQDNFWSAILDVEGKETGILCVCDGMGGLNDGARASEIVVRRVRESFLETGSDIGLGEVISNANDFIRESSGQKKSGTTCVVLICVDGRFLVYNVGDSRCYHWNREGNFVRQITEDHTVIEKYKKEGREITPEIERRYKNVLTRCVGAAKVAKYDIYEGTYHSGDSFLVCSDGFWHTISDRDFLSGEIDNIDHVVQRCMMLGETDNITACILKV